MAPEWQNAEEEVAGLVHHLDSPPTCTRSYLTSVIVSLSLIHQRPGTTHTEIKPPHHRIARQLRELLRGSLIHGPRPIAPHSKPTMRMSLRGDSIISNSSSSSR